MRLLPLLPLLGVLLQMGMTSAIGPYDTSAPSMASVDHPYPPPSAVAGTPKSFPTNAWWQNIVLGHGDEPIMTMPYQVSFRSHRRAGTSLLSATGTNHSSLLRGADAPLGMVFSLPFKTSSKTEVATPFKPIFMFSSSNAFKTPHSVVKYDDLSVTVRYTSTESDSKYFEFPLVKGQSMMTGVYHGMTPLLSTVHAILSANGQTSYPSTLNGVTKMTLKLNDDKTYLVYLSQPSNVEWTTVNTLTVSPSQSDQPLVVKFVRLDDAAEEAIYDEFSVNHPVGGVVEESVDEGAHTVTTRFNFQPFNNNKNLLVFGLPHHQKYIRNGQPSTLQKDTIKGMMRAFIGNSWYVVLPLVPTSFGADRPVSDRYRHLIKESLNSDYNNINIDESTDTYGTFKIASAMARKMLIAMEMDETDKAHRIAEDLKRGLLPWIKGENKNRLMYDTKWGGIVSTNGIKDQNDDFGMAYYNDHHFHYGYLAYALAALGKVDPSFIQQHRQWVVAIARDIANPSREDSHFTKYRCMDMFDSHSWAAGLFPFADNRNQESSSEAINAYYSVALLGRVLGDDNMVRAGQVLVSLEVNGANTYWHSTSGSTVYPADYASNKCAGQVWGSKVVDATFFATGALYVHGINYLPFTPVSEHYMTDEWARESSLLVHADLPNSNPKPTEPWMGLLMGAVAVNDHEEATKNILSYQHFDNGSSRTNMLYWIATRPNTPR